MGSEKNIVSSLPVLSPLQEKPQFTIPSFPYKNIEGSYGTLTRDGAGKITNITWEGCRDRFHQSSNVETLVDFLFYHDKDSSDNIVAFMRTVEELINRKSKVPLQDDDRLEMRKTNNPNVLYVKMSKWWKYRVRRSLLTALLRCGQYYAERTPEFFHLALFSQYYTNDTRPAVEQFFKGRTGSKLGKNMNCDGWYQLFQGKDDKAVRTILVRVTGEKKKRLAEARAARAAAKAAAKAAAVAAT